MKVTIRSMVIEFRLGEREEEELEMGEGTKEEAIDLVI
jgi:hypothetical protein